MSTITYKGSEYRIDFYGAVEVKKKAKNSGNLFWKLANESTAKKVREAFRNQRKVNLHAI